MKICTKCSKIKALDQFNKHTKSPDGLAYWCNECYKKINRTRYEKNQTKIIARVKKWQQEHPDRDRDNARSSAWQKANSGKWNAYIAKKRAKIKERMPKWLSIDHLIEIRHFYEDASRFSKINNEPYHVDHIVPLQGRNVSGLHVPWNLQILKGSENCSKSNKFEMAG